MAATVTYTSGSQTATLQPTAALASSTTYTVVVTGGSQRREGPGRQRDDGELHLVVYYRRSRSTAGNCPCSVWTTSTTPATIDSGDANSAEVGFRFRSDAAGLITGMRFYKGANNTRNSHRAPVDAIPELCWLRSHSPAESGSGWQQVNFSTPVAISANTTYVASYFAPNGHYSANNSYLRQRVWTTRRCMLCRMASTEQTGFTTTDQAVHFPTSTFSSANYWVDVVFVPTGSTTPPTVTSVTPANNSYQVSLEFGYHRHFQRTDDRVHDQRDDFRPGRSRRTTRLPAL